MTATLTRRQLNERREKLARAKRAKIAGRKPALRERSGVTEKVSGGASVSDLERLRAFAQEVMQAWPEGGIDGGDLQEIAEKHGLLIEKQMVAPCCESCNCADCGVSGPTPCYWQTALLTGVSE